jgi:hypothetical protein
MSLTNSICIKFTIKSASYNYKNAWMNLWIALKSQIPISQWKSQSIQFGFAFVANNELSMWSYYKLHVILIKRMLSYRSYQFSQNLILNKYLDIFKYYLSK